MDWVKLSTSFYLDPAIAALPDADAELMFVRSLAYAGLKESSGFVPLSIVPGLCRRRRYEAYVDALLASSLWRPVRGGYQITRWEEWQEELEAITRRRSADRDRKRAERERKKQQVDGMSRDISADNPRTVTPLEKEKNPPNPPRRGGTPCSRHKRWRSGCAACAPATSPPSVFSLCGHGRDGATCPFCRREEDTA